MGAVESVCSVGMEAITVDLLVLVMSSLSLRSGCCLAASPDPCLPLACVAFECV